MRIVAVIQARTGSSRLPGKVLMPIAGATLLERMVERVLAARQLDAVVVATTTDGADDPIRAVCARRGWNCFSGHPTDLLDRHLEAARLRLADVVVKIPSDCPLIDPGIIDRVVRLFREADWHYDFVSNLHPASYPDGCDVEVMSFAALETAWHEARKPHEREHTTPFLWDQPRRFRVGNVRWETGRDLSMTHRLTIDYPEDYQLINAVFEALYRPGAQPFTLDEILAFLDARPEVFALNRELAGVNWYRHHLNELATVSPSETVWRKRLMLNPTSQAEAPRAGVRPAVSENPWQALEAQALRVREHIVRMSGRGGCFIGASLSCADLLVYLYDRVLRVSPQRLRDPSRDYLLLSKGHDVPALYGVLAERGYFDPARLDRHLDPGDHLYWHPNRAIPGVEFHSGSLGHLLSVGMGIALDARLAGSDSRVFVVLGDGELDEGSIWEAVLVAAAHRLDNLVLVIDRNEFQANIETERLIPLEPLAEKLSAFGLAVRRTDGHSFPRWTRRLPTCRRWWARPPPSSPRPCEARACPAWNGGRIAGSCVSPPEVDGAAGRAARPGRGDPDLRNLGGALT